MQTWQSNVWWHDAYASKLGNFGIVGSSDSDSEAVKKKAKKVKPKKDRKDKKQAGVDDGFDIGNHYEAVFKASGGARLGMRARRSQPGKGGRE